MLNRSDSGRTDMILLSATSGKEMASVRDVDLGFDGLDGDRYAIGLGKWSTWPDQSGKALTMVESEVLDEIGIGAVEVRRNIVTSGIHLEMLLGKKFGIGTAICIGVRPCLPCRYLEDLTREGLREQLVGIRGGLRADVVRPGRLWVGSEVYLLETEDEYES